MKKLIIIIITLHASLFTLHVTEAQVINVPADQPSIQAGINAASSGDTVLVADGTYFENINFNGKAITVASHFLVDADTNHINNTIIDGSQPANPDYGSVVTFITGEDTTSVLCGFTITGGTGSYIALDEIRFGGGIACYYAGAKIINNKITNNETYSINDAEGAGIASYHDLSEMWVVIENNTIRGNFCHGIVVAGGGGIFVGNHARIRNNIIENNLVIGENIFAMGGGIHLQNSYGSSDTVYLFDNLIQHNTTSSNDFSRGGGVFSIDNYLLIQNNYIAHDSLYGDRTNGGGLCIINPVYLEMTNNVITQNIVEKITIYWGAGVFCVGPQGPVIITKNVFSHNTGEHTPTGAGGGFSIADGYDYPILVDGNHFLSNSGYHGGGFYERNCYNLKLTNNIFVENDSYRGGAIGMYHGAQGSSYRPQIVNNTFYSNAASNDAGAIRFTGDYQSAPMIMNCIFWENSAPDYSGKDIYNWSTDTLLVYYSDIDKSLINGPWNGKNNLFADPVFLDSLCHLNAISPCLDIGIDSLEYGGTWYYCPLIDVDGDVRPYPSISCDPVPDIGADESEFDCVGENEFNTKHAAFNTQIYPNPARGIVHCTLYIVHFSFVRVSLYNLQGQEVGALLDKELSAGEHYMWFDVSDLPDGMYFLRLTAGEKTTTQKLIIKN